MSTILLGGAGRIGTQLRLAMDDAGIRYSAPTRDQFDVIDRSSLRDLFKVNLASGELVDTVINTTAYHDTKGCEADPAKAFAMNASTPRWLAAECALRRLRFVHFSTDYVFGEYPAACPGGYDRYEAPAPVNVYGNSKAAGETIVMAVNSQALIVRTASLFGSPADRGDFVKLVRQRVKDDVPMQVVDDVTMSPTYTRDLAEALIHHALPAEQLRGVIHMVGGGCSVTWYEFARYIATLLKGPTDFITPTTMEEFDGDTLPRPASSVLKSGFQLSDWRTSVEAYLRWLDNEEAA